MRRVYSFRNVSAWYFRSHMEFAETTPLRESASLWDGSSDFSAVMFLCPPSGLCLAGIFYHGMKNSDGAEDSIREQ